MRQARLLATCLLILAIGSHAHSGELSNASWSVVVSTYYEEDSMCEGQSVLVDVDSRTADTLEISIEPGPQHVEWEPPRLEFGERELHVQVVSCSGVRSPIGSLKFRLEPEATHKELYIGLRYESGLVELAYLEVYTEWDAEGLLSLHREGDEVFLQNDSNETLRRCELEKPLVEQELEVRGEWSSDHPTLRRSVWPEDQPVLGPGDRVSLTQKTVVTVKAYRPPDRAFEDFRSSAYRFEAIVQPRLRHFVAFTDPPWSPPGLPRCDRYVFERPATQADPSIRVWDD